MLHFEPTGILASSFRVTRGAREKTTLSLGWLRETGSFSHRGKRYTLDRTGWISGDFTLRLDGRRLAGAVGRGDPARAGCAHRIGALATISNSAR